MLSQEHNVDLDRQAQPQNNENAVRLLQHPASSRSKKRLISCELSRTRQLRLSTKHMFLSLTLRSAVGIAVSFGCRCTYICIHAHT